MSKKEKRLPQKKGDCSTVIRVDDKCYQCNKQLDWRVFPSDTSWDNIQEFHNTCFTCLYNSVEYVRCNSTGSIYMPFVDGWDYIEDYPKSIKTDNGESWNSPACYEKVGFSHNEPDNENSWVYYYTVLQLDSCEECAKYTSKIKYGECSINPEVYLNVTLTWSGNPTYRYFQGACFTSGQTRAIAPRNYGYVCYHSAKTYYYWYPGYTYTGSIPDAERWSGINYEIALRAGTNYANFNMVFNSGTFAGNLSMGNHSTAGTNINSNNIASKWITPGAIVPNVPIRGNMKTGSVTFTNGVTISWTPFNNAEWNTCGN